MTSSRALCSKTAAGVLAASTLAAGCSGPVASAPAAAGPRLTVPGVPPEIVEALLFGGIPNDAPHELFAWEGGAFRHCIASAELDAKVIDEAARIVAAATWIPEAQAGPCNVTWEVAPALDSAAATKLRHPDGQDPGPIIGATIYVKAGRELALPLAVHELGHAIGLGHSPRRDDAMFRAFERRGGFSPDELAVIGAVYRK